MPLVRFDASPKEASMMHGEGPAYGRGHSRYVSCVDVRQGKSPHVSFLYAIEESA